MLCPVISIGLRCVENPQPILNCATSFSSMTDVWNVFSNDEKPLWHSKWRLTAPSSSKRNSKGCCLFCNPTNIKKQHFAFLGMVVFPLSTFGGRKEKIKTQSVFVSLFNIEDNTNLTSCSIYCHNQIFCDKSMCKSTAPSST